MIRDFVENSFKKEPSITGHSFTALINLGHV